MSEYKIIKSKPGKEEHELFTQVPKNLYPEKSQRFHLGFEPSMLFLQGCYTLIKSEKPIGRFAFYVNPALLHEGESAGCIGSYECEESSVATLMLINHAKQIATELGLKWLIGPMEGSTWESYRWSDSNELDNFFMEPFHHSYYAEQFTETGFQKIGKYVSALDKTMLGEEAELASWKKSFEAQGAVIRNLDTQNLREELGRIAKLSIEAFSDNFLYTPISEEEFIAKYEKISTLLNPEWIWIAEDKTGEPHAFLFAIPDLWDKEGKTIILKTVARKKDSAFKGIGKFMTASLNVKAKKQGIKQVIHAFMYDENVSSEVSEQMQTEPYKSYSLYGLKL